LGKIRILDEFTINQIAAGEVIERPASIVKELVENSIDANSTAITIEIQNGGMSLIRVTDNGEGMDQADALVSFQRHATSKISSASDLEKIGSLGFRGEALASIAAVTQMEMITRARDTITGFYVLNHGGKIIEQKEVGCPEGTTIIVRNLFYNAPARLKFLKSPRAETANISDLVSKLILGHPEISFKYLSQGKVIYHSPGNGSALSAVLCIYGKELKGEIIEIDRRDEETGLQLKGFLGKPSLSRTNRNNQSFFVSGRTIKSELLSKCVEDAYDSYLMINHFPWAVLYLDLPASQVDVNVHPAKTEVRFKDEDYIYQTLYQWIREALKSHPYIPSIAQNFNEEKQADFDNQNKKIANLSQREREPRLPFFENANPGEDDLTPNQILSEERSSHIYIVDKDRESDIGEEISLNCMNGIKNDHTNNILDLVSYKIIGRVFSTYVIVEGDRQLFFIDQHAAHERLLYEELKDKMEKQEISVQQLLPPIVIELTHQESMLLTDSMETFASLGFEVEPFGDRTFMIRGIPTMLTGANIQRFFQDLLDQVMEHGSSSPSSLKAEDIIRMACKKAVKAHDPLSEKEIVALLNQMQNSKIPMTCPHGRPIMIAMTQYEMEKLFKRIQ